MQIKYIPSPSAGSPGLLRKAVALVMPVALAGIALMFSAMLLAVILIVVIFGSAFLWWKTREIRKQMQNFPPFPRSATMQSDNFTGEAFKGEVIEGEVIRVEEPRATGRC